MTVLLVCLAIAASLQFLTKVPVAMAMAKLPGGYDNKSPRVQQTKLQGWGLRALGAHQNAFEAFPTFAAGVLACLVGKGDLQVAQGLAVAFVLIRLLYTAAYLANIDRIRSLLFILGLGCSFGLMLLPLFN